MLLQAAQHGSKDRGQGRQRNRSKGATQHQVQLAALDQDAMPIDASPASAKPTPTPAPLSSPLVAVAQHGSPATVAAAEAGQDNVNDDAGDQALGGVEAGGLGRPMAVRRGGMHNASGSSGNSTGSNAAAPAGSHPPQHEATRGIQTADQVLVTRKSFLRQWIATMQPLARSIQMLEAFLQTPEGQQEDDNGPVPESLLSQSKLVLRDAKKRNSAARRACKSAKQQNLARQRDAAKPQAAANSPSQQAAAGRREQAVPHAVPEPSAAQQAVDNTQGNALHAARPAVAAPLCQTRSAAAAIEATTGATAPQGQRVEAQDTADMLQLPTAGDHDVVEPQTGVEAPISPAKQTRASKAKEQTVEVVPGGVELAVEKTTEQATRQPAPQSLAPHEMVRPAPTLN